VAGKLKKASKLKKVPEFKSEAEERDFWLTHDATRYLDLSQARPAIFPNLQPTSRTISIRLPEILLAEIKTLAAKRGVPYQSLMKVLLTERVEEELEAR
jgi:predicted DNA binding CopG/RHH family protein